ncbi:glycosyltransferase family 2 protein [Sulfurimonas microaerophilic]|uniref:glycosyltransferase family 2 protein n=1 Tax=Sulfurimonas microaerophilic TaxID=3058392 RepID=UPI002714A385|nr:glycosyltransferase family 2 protein [Sulfurimonas sp. hsl 1-7]
MDNKPLLTIAIPTYNRSVQLQNTLNSIINQSNFDISKIEILISDNASQDNTIDVVQSYQEKFPFIHYYKNDVNLGIDYNIYKCVDLSRTDYVYLLSDDDILLGNSIKKMLELIENNPNISFFYLNGIGFKFDDNNHKVFYDNPVMQNKGNILFTDKNKFINLIRLQSTFISAFLLHRETWNINRNKERLIGTDIYLTYDLFHLLSNSKKYMFVSEPLVGVHESYTAGNYRIFHAFAHQWRQLLLEEAPSIGFDRDIMKKIFKQTLKHLKGKIKGIKQGNLNSELDFKTLKLIFTSLYDTKVFWLYILPALIKPKFIYKLELFLNNTLRLKKKS